MLFNLFKKSNKVAIGNMRVSHVSENYMTSPQISVADVADAKAYGFDTIMCNRPDNEESGQTNAAQIERAAKKAGLKFFYVPMSHRGMAPDTVDNFRAATVPANGKVLAYCRSGNRCNILWKMAQK